MKSSTWPMFDRIAKRYDVLNGILSFGIDKIWRKTLIAALPKNQSQSLLDLGTGTGDILFTLLKSKQAKYFSSLVGADKSIQMLEMARRKLLVNHAKQKVHFEEQDANALTFASNQFDAVTMAFAIRNVENLDQTLKEILRVLKPNGKLCILEFSLPSSRLIRAGYLFYFRTILPTIGGLISGDKKAYVYLNTSVEAFPYGEGFVKCLQKAGFNRAKQTPLTLGIATLYQAQK